ncbi:MAG TPA: Hpt domain-containing protein [Fontimonas sp.]
MEAQTDKEVGSSARVDGGRLALVCADPVLRVLVLRSLERLGRPAPEQYTDLAGALAAACSVVLIDEADLPPDSARLLDSAASRPRLIVLSAQVHVALAGADASLRKPPGLQALADALDAASPANDSGPGFDRAIWDELLDLFGRDGVAEMLVTLQQDLPQQRQRLAAALPAEDRVAIRRIAHSLRGVALQFGAASLAADFGTLEVAAGGDSPLATLGRDAAALLDRQAALIRALERAMDAA